MSEEKDFFKTCFNIVVELEVKNESQAIAKEVILSEIKNLQKENKHLDWVNCHLRKINEKLKERIAYLERSNNRRECTILEQRQEISDLEDNWNKLKEYVGAEWYCYDNDSVEFEVAKDILNKMQELQGSDSNE